MVPAEVGVCYTPFPRLEMSYPLLWYHSRFAWSAAEQQHTLLARATVTHSPRLSLPGRDGTLLVKQADGSYSKRHMACCQFPPPTPIFDDCSSRWLRAHDPAGRPWVAHASPSVMSARRSTEVKLVLAPVLRSTETLR